jgi:hypothetical protein
MGITCDSSGTWRDASGALVAWSSASVPGTWFVLEDSHPQGAELRAYLDGVPLPPASPPLPPVAVTRETLTPRWVDALTPSQRTKLLKRIAAADPALVARVRAEVLGG